MIDGIANATGMTAVTVVTVVTVVIVVIAVNMVAAETALAHLMGAMVVVGGPEVLFVLVTNLLLAPRLLLERARMAPRATTQ
jgi:hypothetical protein